MREGVRMLMLMLMHTQTFEARKGRTALQVHGGVPSSSPFALFGAPLLLRLIFVPRSRTGKRRPRTSACTPYPLPTDPKRHVPTLPLGTIVYAERQTDTERGDQTFDPGPRN